MAPNAALITCSADEAHTFLVSVREDRLYAAFALSLTTGLRRGELLGLAWRDIDLSAGWLHVRQTLVSVNYQIQLSTPKTDSGRRSVALDQGIVEILRKHRRNRLEERLQLGLGALQPDDLVFSTLAGGPLHPSLFTDAFDRRVKAAGVPRIRLHDCRHTAATLMLIAGVSPKVVSERLGHSSVSLTLDLYTHSVPSLQEEAAAKVANMVL
jgi:integrase